MNYMTEASGHAGGVLGSGSPEDKEAHECKRAPVGGADAGAGDNGAVAREPGGEAAASLPGEEEAVGANPALPGPSALDVAEAWLAELADQVSVPASEVQDHLLDIWGALEDGPARVEVERWLTETLRRNLYSVSDVNERLGSLLPAG